MVNEIRIVESRIFLSSKSRYIKYIYVNMLNDINLKVSHIS